MGPTMAREADSGPEGLPTHWASVDGCCSEGGGSTGFAHHTFLLCLYSVSLLSGMGTCEDFAMPGCAIGIHNELLPVANVDVQVLGGKL